MPGCNPFGTAAAQFQVQQQRRRTKYQRCYEADRRRRALDVFDDFCLRQRQRIARNLDTRNRRIVDARVTGEAEGDLQLVVVKR